MIKCLQFVPEHLELFDWRSGEKELYSHLGSEDMLAYHELGVCYTAFADGRILLIGGVYQTTETSGACATFVSKYANGYGLSLIRAVKGQLEDIMDTMGIHRVETSNIKGQNEHMRWCRLLGFEVEGEMQYYDAMKRTYVRMAKIKDLK